MISKPAFRAFRFRRIGSLRASVSPVSILFGANEPGILYDISSVANLDWRRNLLTFSEDFSNAVWSPTGATKTTGISDPFGGITAATITSTSANGQILFSVSGSLGTATTYTGSLWVRRRSGTGLISLFNPNGGGLTSISITSEWARYSVTGFGGSATNFTGIRLASSGDAVDVAFAQLELGSTATEYQRITDVHTEVRERFPQTTLFQDRAGSQPVTTPGQSVGMILDRSRGLVLGPELASGGWGVIAGSGLSGSNSNINAVAAVDNSRIRLPFSTVSGSTYDVTINVSSVSAGSLRLFSGSTVLATYSTVGVRSFKVSASGTNFDIVAVGTSTTAAAAISVREIPGFHAVANSDAARGVYGIEPFGGRRNLLTFTEQFDGAGWTQTSLAISTNSVAAPTGEIVADTATRTTTGTAENLRRTATTQAANTAYTLSCYVRANTPGARLYMRNLAVDGSLTTGVVHFNPQNGEVSTTFGSTFAGNAAMVDLGGGWYRCRMSGSTGATIPNNLVDIGVTNGASATGGTAGDSIFIWGAQLELGSTATPYQRVTTAFDVTEAGVPNVHYVELDGADDGYVTSTITPGTDKAQVFAGVRKLSDAARAILLEYSTSSSSTGAFGVDAPQSGPAQNYIFTSTGTTPRQAIASGYAAPISNVLTGLGDISGDRAILRVNGIQVAQSTADQGTGNFLAYPLFIGRRGGTTLPFRGRIYALSARFGANLTNDQITQMERWVASKTGVTL